MGREPSPNPLPVGPQITPKHIPPPMVCHIISVFAGGFSVAAKMKCLWLAFGASESIFAREFSINEKQKCVGLEENTHLLSLLKRIPLQNAHFRPMELPEPPREAPVPPRSLKRPQGTPESSKEGPPGAPRSPFCTRPLP